MKEKENKQKKEKVKQTKTVSKNAKKTSYFKAVKSELKKVKWPERKEVVKYTIATIVFVLILVALFIALNIVMSLIKGAF